jgi:futalosine hydrolase
MDEKMESGRPGLVCAATWEELQTFGLEGGSVLEEGRLLRIPEGLAATTGVGAPLTLLRLLPLIDSLRPAWIVNTGLAGAYPGSGLAIGDVVVGTSEVFADLGMETPDKEGFLPLSTFPFADEILRNPLPLWVPDWAARHKKGHGATVNQVTGTDGTGKLRRDRFGADFETMEGAAVALAAKERNLPLLEVRAVSNFAARRDMREENVRSALESLKVFWKDCRRHLA